MRTHSLLALPRRAVLGLRPRGVRTAVLAALVGASLACAPSASAAGTSTAPPSTPVHLSASQVARVLFVAGDVGRLSQVPSGTESVVLERVLQQLYTDDPTLDPTQAASDVHALQSVLSSGSQALSPATLTVMAGNERVLAILRALSDSGQPAGVAHALALVTDTALTASSNATQTLGQPFDASADALDTLSYGPFSPTQTLLDTATMAAANQLFGEARDLLWQQSSNESVFDATHKLTSENPALQNAAITSIVNMLGADGSLASTVGSLEQIVAGGINQIGQQNCTLQNGSSGGSAADCASGALHDALAVTAQCGGGNSGSPGCLAAKGQAGSDSAAEIATIRAAQAADAAAAAALSGADQALSQAEEAEAQAAAALAQQENQFLAFQNFGQLEKGGFDFVGLAVTITDAEINPVGAISGLVNVIGDALGYTFPSGEQLILQGIQNLSQQLSDFEAYTQTAFSAIDAQLSSISGLIAQESLALSTQLTQTQQQVTQLAMSVGRLQTDVDHLQSEVQSLFAQGARNDLGTLVNQYIGFAKTNGQPLSLAQFAQAAGALYQDATSTALTSTILNPLTVNSFDALDAGSLVTTDPISLDSNINYFNYFPALVSDSPTSWPGVLTTQCPATSNPSQLFCLPDPDFWATSARAFAQLLMENPQYVTPTRVTQLNTIMQEGQSIAAALQQLSVNNAGADPNQTGNATLDAAINYYDHWGSAAVTPPGAAPSLRAAIKNEEQAYLGQTVLTGQTFSEADLNPWGGVAQTPDVTGLLTLKTVPTNIPICPSEQAILPTGPVNTTVLTIPHLTPGTLSFLPPQVLNAVRLQQGKLTACWTAYADPPFNSDGTINFTTTITYTYVSNDGAAIQQVGQTSASVTNVANCANPNFALTAAAVIDVADSWPGSATPNSACTDVSGDLSQPAGQTTTYPAALAQVIEPQITASLHGIQANVYNDIIKNGSLTNGSSEATNVAAAANRLAGANALLDGYVSLGLPQAVASDDTLHGLILGQDADPFTPTNDPGLNPWGVPYRASVPDQVVAFYQAALAALPTFDPADFLGSAIDLRAFRLRQAIYPHIVATTGPVAPSAAANAQGALQLNPHIAAPSLATAFRAAVTRAAVARATVAPAAASAPAASAAPAGTPTVFAETNPVVGATLDRLDLTAAAIQDAINASTTTPPTATNTTPTTTIPTPAAPGATTPAAPTSPQTTIATPRLTCTARVASNQVRLQRRRRSKVTTGTVTASVTCNGPATVTLTGTLTQVLAPKTKRRPARTKRYGLGPVRASEKAGRRAQIVVTLPAAALTALQRGATESASLTVRATGTAGRATVTTAIRTLRRGR